MFKVKFLVTALMLVFINGCSVASKMKSSPKTYGKYYPINKGIPQIPESLKKEENKGDNL